MKEMYTNMNEYFKKCEACYGIIEVNKSRRGGRELGKGRKGELHYLMNETV
jgi:hypothetical protein